MAASARDIVRFAKKTRFTLSRGRTGYNNAGCARAALATMALGAKKPGGWRLYEESTNQAIGLTEKQLNSLEMGFEAMPGYINKNLDQRYFKVGQNVAKMIGLD